MADYTFFTNPMSRGQIARWALHEAGVSYEQVLVVWAHKPDALIAANPMGKVPTIIHHAPGGDRVVTEAAGICAYLAHANPAANLGPTDQEAADYYRWLFFAAGPIESAVMARALKLEVSKQQEGMVGWGSYDRVIETLDGLLSGRRFVCGDRFTMADVYVGSQVDWGLTFGTLPPLPSFAAYAERLQTREAYKAAKQIDNALIAETKA